MQMIHIRKLTVKSDSILDYDSQGREEIIIDPYIFIHHEFANSEKLASYYTNVRQAIIDTIDKYEAISLNNLLFEIACELHKNYQVPQIKIEIDDEAQSHYFTNGTHEVKIGDKLHPIEHN